MTHRIHTEADLDLALAELAKLEVRFGQALALAGRPPLRRAKAIWGRLAAALDPLDHAAILRARPAKLARAGLSAPKIRTLKAIAKAIDRGELVLPALLGCSADEAHAALTAIHGIGPWTADIYLLFCLGHADAWPAGDLALQESARLLFKRKSRPTAKEMLALAEPWRPWRGAAAYLLWTYYRVARQRAGAPAQPTTKRSAA
jgi:DNA-3-methyladenine glycosylase II